MAKSPTAPAGFYTATEAIKKLGMPRTSFYNLVDKGVIKKVVQPGRTEGYYLKAAIDDLVKARELFTIQYASDAAVFQKATAADVQGIYDLAVSLWGTRGTYPYEVRLERYRKNSDIFYVLKFMDVVVGYLTFMPVAGKAVDEIMATGKRASSVITVDDILPFVPGTSIEYVFLEIAIRDGVPRPRQYAMHLMLGMSSVLADLAQKDVVIKHFFATSRTKDGIELSRRLGFDEISLPSSEGTRAFLLDVDKSSHPLLHEYKEILQKHNP